MRNKKILCKTILAFLFVFVLSFSLVNANLYWSQEANANYDLGVSGVRGIAYGSNYLNPIENLTGTDYFLCPITKSDYTPIVSDFGQTGVLKVVVTDTSTNKLSIYNPDCTLFQEINVGSDIEAMPVLVRPKSYYDQWIVVLSSGTNKLYLKAYEYNLDTGVFDKKKDIDVSIAGGVPFYLTCFDFAWDSENNPKCFVAFQYLLSEYGYVIDLETEQTGSLKSDFVIYRWMESYDYSGLSNFRNPIDEEQFYITLGFLGLYPPTYNKFRGELIDINISVITSYDSEGTFLFEDTDFKDASDFIAKIGNSYRVFSYRFTGVYGANNYYSSVFINDLSGNNLFYIVSTENGTGTFNMNNITYKRFSNWAVADYDKDGSNEACFLIKKPNDDIWLQCYESTLSQSNGDIRVNYTGLIDDISNIVLADFIPSKNVLGIATKEGIFYPNDKVYSTNKTADFGYTITTYNNIYAQTPMYVYTDDDEGFIVYADIEIDSCGNQDCEYWETPVSCPEDCYQLAPDEDPEGEFREGSECETNEDCDCNLCEAGVCVKLRKGMNCIIEGASRNDCCLSGSCVNGKCTKEGLWSLVDASKTQWYGDDVNTNNLLSLIIILVIAGLVASRVIWLGIIVFYALEVFFALVGWLSPFILVGTILIGAIALVFGLIIGSRGQ